MSGGVRITGQRELGEKFKQAPEKVVGAIAAAVYQKMLQVMTDSKKLCVVGPTGNLRRSAYVEKPSLSGSIIRCPVGYGANYAIFVHERTELHHKKGQAKFLTTAFEKHAPGMSKWIALQAKQNLENGLSMPLAAAAGGQ